MFRAAHLWRFGLAVLAALALPQSVSAQELLVNGSYESPVVPANGNNFYVTIPGWTIFSISPARPQPWNVIRPWSGYSGNPTVPPTGGGIQYLDINSAAGTIRQTVTVPSQGMVDFGGWFSVRDFSQALTGLTIRIREANGTVISSASTSFVATDPIGLWKRAGANNVPVSAGTYIFEVEIPDFGNFDLATMVFKPTLSVTKSSAAFSDPVNGTTNPKLIPGGIAEYTITVASPSSYAVSSNSLAISDATPVNSQLIVADFGGAGSGPAAFAAGASGLTYSFASLASTSDSIQFSNNNGLSWTYAPSPNANGADSAVTNVRIQPQGTMAAGSSASVRLRYLVN
jgi:hypothetical protein